MHQQQSSVLLDVGGVLIDQRLRTQQWPHLAGEAFVGLLGGSLSAWIAAHRFSTYQLEQQVSLLAAPGNFLSFLRTYHLAWVKRMCALVGVPTPSDEDCLVLASRAIATMSGRVQAALPGAVETIWTLHRQGYPLHTASGAWPLEVAGYLQAMAVRACVGTPYGADLINAFKAGPEFYVRLFADLGISPAEAVVIDVNAEAISWASQAGARTVLVQLPSPHKTAQQPRVSHLTEVPALLSRFS